MSNPRPGKHRLQDQLDRQVRRARQAEKRRSLAAVVQLGTLGLTMVLPVVAGAYLGSWLDAMSEGYSVTWTVSLVLLGVVAGSFGVYQAIQRSDE